jgi:hypothetical protein
VFLAIARRPKMRFGCTTRSRHEREERQARGK